MVDTPTFFCALTKLTILQAMDVDEISASNMAHPLREIAERVGREVELFAEKMDTLKPAFDASKSEKRERAGLLVKEYRSIAEETVSRLTKEHGDEQQRQFKKRWQGRRAYLADEEEEENFGASYKDSRGKTVLADLEDWQGELQTWQLLDGLLDCRYPHDASTPAEQHAQDLTTGQDRFEADGSTWTDFLSTSDSARDKLTILKWLESTANTDRALGGDLDMIEEELEEATMKKKSLFTSAWSDTKSCIKAEKVLQLWEGAVDSAQMTAEVRTRDGTGTVVTQLDFDAVTRQRRHIEMADREFESCFWNICWVMLRRGMPMSQVREWCAERNEFARALAVGATFARQGGESTDAEIHARLRWRRTCRQLAKDGGGFTSAERAVFALLGGERGMVEKMSRNWYDFLYASVNSLLLGQYETYVLQHHAAGVPPAMQQAIRSAISTSVSEDAVQGIRTVLAALNKDEDSQPDPRFQAIQATIIADNIKQMLFHQGVSLARQAIASSAAEFSELIERDVATLMSEDQYIEPISDEPNILRILAHLYLVFLDLGVDFGTKQELMATENVLAAYIAFLQLSGKKMPIPSYAARLSPDRCNTVMARVISDVQTDEQRATMMEMMESAGIDVLQVIEKQYEAAIQHTQIGQDQNNFTLQLCSPTNQSMWPGRRVFEPEDLSVTTGEELLIHSLEWFLLLDRQWAMTFAALTDVAIRLLRKLILNSDIGILLTKMQLMVVSMPPHTYSMRCHTTRHRHA
jgi:nuclear pore complex protein Nup107